MAWQCSGLSNEEMVNKLVENELLKDARVVDAFRNVSRKFFFPSDNAQEVFKDAPILKETKEYDTLHQSAPHMYAMIAESLDVRAGNSFLNVGSGTGYFSAIVAHLLGPTGTNHGCEVRPGNVKFARDGVDRFFEETANFAPIVLRHGNVFCIDAKRNILYDRIYVGADCPKDRVNDLVALLGPNGLLLVPTCGELRLYNKDQRGKLVGYNVVCGVRYAELVLPEPGDSFFIFEAKEDVASMTKMSRKPSKGRGKQPALPPPSDRVDGFDTYESFHAPPDMGDLLPSSSAPSRGIEASDVMISFNVRTAKGVAEKLADMFAAVGLRAWVCTRDLDGGNHWRREILRAIRNCRVFVPLINEEWAVSGECELELNLTLQLHTHSKDKPRLPHIVPLSFPGLDKQKHDHVYTLAAMVNFISYKPKDDSLKQLVANVVTLLQGGAAGKPGPAPAARAPAVALPPSTKPFSEYDVEEVCVFVRSIKLEDTAFHANAVTGEDLLDFVNEYHNSKPEALTDQKCLALKPLQVRKLLKAIEKVN